MYESVSSGHSQLQAVPPSAVHPLSKQVLFWIHSFDTIEQLRPAPVAFVDFNNHLWPVEQIGFRSPAQAR